MTHATLTPDLPTTFPHRALILRTLAGLRGDPVWVAYMHGVVGVEVVEAIMYRAAFLAISVQNLHDGAEPEIADTMRARTDALKSALIDAFGNAIGFACGHSDLR